MRMPWQVWLTIPSTDTSTHVLKGTKPSRYDRSVQTQSQHAPSGPGSSRHAATPGILERTAHDCQQYWCKKKNKMQLDAEHNLQIHQSQQGPCFDAGVGPESGAAAADTDCAQGYGDVPGLCHKCQAAVLRFHRWQHRRVDGQGQPTAGQHQQQQCLQAEAAVNHPCPVVQFTLAP